MEEDHVIEDILLYTNGSSFDVKNYKWSKYD